MSKEERYGMQMRRDRAQAMVIRKDSILCNPGILGSGILATNLSQISKDTILDYSNKLVDIYKDAKYKDYDGSLYIQHL